MTLQELTFFLFLLGCGSPSQVQGPASPSPKPAPEVSESGDWFVSPDQDSTRFRNAEGVRAFLVPVRSKADPTLRDRYLLRITGSSSSSDGLVVLVTRAEKIRDVVYSARLRGNSVPLIRYKKSSTVGGAQPNWQLYGYDANTQLGAVQPVDAPVDANEIVRLRQKQQQEEISAIETLDRASIIAANDTQHQMEVAGATELCGKFESSIDWSTTAEAMKGGLSIAGQCSDLIRSMKDFCRLHPGRLQRETKPVRLSCTFDDAPRKERERPMKVDASGTLIFIAGSGDNRWRKRMHFLRMHFGEDDQILRGDSALFVVRHRENGAEVYLSEGKVFTRVTQVSGVMRDSYPLPGRVNNEYLVRTKAGWVLDCEEKETPLQNVEGKERAAILEKAQFETEPRWKRAPYFLARDSRGTYYYVDRYRKKFGGGRYQVFVGRKGQLKLSKLKRLVEDSEGTLFSTSKGDLRLVVSAGTRTAVWIKGKKSTPLTSVNVIENRALIFDELGVYYGEKLGFPCK